VFVVGNIVLYFESVWHFVVVVETFSVEDFQELSLFLGVE
jgi:hypothetical protein